MSNHREVAEQIADDLFTNGQGDEASRLVLVQNKNPDDLSEDWPIGGWCKAAVVDRITRVLDAAAPLSGWQEISSAPKVTTILTQHIDDLFPVAAFCVSDADGDHWIRETEGPEDTTDRRKGKYEPLYRAPTHWQPLPSAPGTESVAPLSVESALARLREKWPNPDEYIYIKQWSWFPEMSVEDRPLEEMRGKHGNVAIIRVDPRNDEEIILGQGYTLQSALAAALPQVSGVASPAHLQPLGWGDGRGPITERTTLQTVDEKEK